MDECAFAVRRYERACLPESIENSRPDARIHANLGKIPSGPSKTVMSIWVSSAIL
jgi:hypothetical protein